MLGRIVLEKFIDFTLLFFRGLRSSFAVSASLFHYLVKQQLMIPSSMRTAENKSKLALAPTIDSHNKSIFPIRRYFLCLPQLVAPPFFFFVLRITLIFLFENKGYRGALALAGAAVAADEAP